MGSPADISELSTADRVGVFQRARQRWFVIQLEKQFWIFFTAAFFFDFGFDLYFFLFNLFLLKMHCDEHTMGTIASALAIGNLAGTIPVSVLARRFGLKKLLLFCFIAAPVISICRTLTLWILAQIVLAFFTGVALSVWPVCFAPTVARLTSESNRMFAFSVIFATGIGSGTLAGALGGYLPQVISSSAHTDLAYGIRFMLIVASLAAMLGTWSVAKLELPQKESGDRKTLLSFHPYLLRFLPAFALWSFVTGSFIPFAPVFFSKQLGVSLQHVGLIFSGSELAQFCAVLLIPLIYRRTGTLRGMVLAQICTAALAWVLGRTQAVPFAIGCYLSYAALQFTTGPAFYGTLMSQIPEAERSSASAMQNIAGAIAQAGASAVTGIMVIRVGYGLVFSLNALLGCSAAALAVLLLSERRRSLSPSINSA